MSNEGFEEEKSFEFLENHLRVDEKIVNEHYEGGVIGDSWTELAMKNEQTYMIITSPVGMKVIKHHEEIFSGDLHSDFKFFENILFIDHLDCFFIYVDKKLYRKDIDDKPAYLFAYLKDLTSAVNGLKYSRINNPLVLFKDFQFVSFYSIDEKREELRAGLKGASQDIIMDYILFGKQDNCICSVTQFGYINLHIFNCSMRKLLTFSYLKVTLEGGYREILSNVKICDSSKYIFVDTKVNPRGGDGLRIFVFKLEGCRLSKMAVVNQVERIWQFGVGGCFGAHIFSVGIKYLTVYGTLNIYIYEYNTKTKNFRFFKEKTLLKRDKMPSQLHRYGKNLYFTLFTPII